MHMHGYDLQGYYVWLSHRTSQITISNNKAADAYDRRSIEQHRGHAETFQTSSGGMKREWLLGGLLRNTHKLQLEVYLQLEENLISLTSSVV